MVNATNVYGCYAIKLAKDAHQREEPHRALRR